MNLLCLSTELTSTEFASWVQAIGSILAIIAAALIAIWQTGKQHRSALRLQIAEHERVRNALAQTLSILATNCAKAVSHISLQLRDREAIHEVGTGVRYLDIGEVRRIDATLANIPLQGLPHTLVTSTMTLSALVRQFLAKIDMAIRAHRQMDAAAFNELFTFIEFTNQSLDATVRDISTVVDSRHSTRA